jgi:hypothetical protein
LGVAATLVARPGHRCREATDVVAGHRAVVSLAVTPMG